MGLRTWVTGSGISRRLLVRVVLFSTVITLLISIAQLYIDYKTDIDVIKDQLQQVEDVHLTSLSAALWVSDIEDLQTKAEGIMRLRDMQYLEISDKNKQWLVYGSKKNSGEVMSRSLPMIYRYRGRDIEIGTITVVASLDGVYRRLWDQAVTILISNGIKTFLVAIFILSIFHRLVTRHIHRIAEHTANFDGNSVDQELSLDRGVGKEKDELDILVESTNDMHLRLKKSLDALRHAYDDLDDKVVQRTIELQQATELAEKANQSKTLFLSRMSHELRTPLNAVLGFAQLLKMELQDKSEAKDFAHEIETGGKHLLELIDEVMDLSRIEMGQIKMHLEEVELASVVNEVLLYIRPKAEQRGISIKIPECSGIRVLADKVRLKEVLLNLLSNAVKYNNENGSITLACSHGSQGMFAMSVTDSGPGLSEEQLGLLFEPFSRLGAEYSGIEGTGIGLTITKSLVELMAGRIEVSSELGKGTEFRVSLPMPKTG